MTITHHTSKSSAESVDVRILACGSVYLFVLLTDLAHEWVDEWVSDDRLMLGAGLAVEHRYASALAEGMLNDGLALRVEGGF